MGWISGLWFGIGTRGHALNWGCCNVCVSKVFSHKLMRFCVYLSAYVMFSSVFSDLCILESTCSAGASFSNVDIVFKEESLLEMQKEVAV